MARWRVGGLALAEGVTGTAIGRSGWPGAGGVHRARPPHPTHARRQILSFALSELRRRFLSADRLSCGSPRRRQTICRCHSPRFYLLAAERLDVDE